jgi:diguanylate cyclase (GGDEF)-like protein/PAS domain S-box-containing protein
LFTKIADNLGHALYVRQDNKFIWINESFAKLFGYPKEEVLQMSIFDLIHPDYFDYMNDMVSTFQSSEHEHFSFEVKGIKKDGTFFDISIVNSIIMFKDKRMAIGSVYDITERKKIELELMESKQRYQTLVEHSPFGIIVHQNGIIEYANPMALSILGVESSGNIHGLRVDSIIHPEFKAVVSNRIHGVETQGEFTKAEYIKLIGIDGQEKNVEVKGMPILLNGTTAVQIVFWDVTEKKKEEDLIKFRAYHDPITDLPNRHKFQLDLEEEINKDTTFTIMYLCTNGIMQINEDSGHQAGDLVIMKVAARLTGAIGSDGLVYRLGGDKFSVVFSGLKTEEEIRSLAQRIEEVVNRYIYINNRIEQVATNIGVVYYPNHGVDMNILLSHAQMALQHALKSKTLYKIYDE